MIREDDTTRIDDAPPPPDPPPGPGLPATIGRFAIRALLGQGGMGVVFDAWDPELKRRVAIKLLRPSLRAGPIDTNARVRLQREAEALARLSHPNVVQIYEAGQWSDTVFLAMEFIEGDNLGAWLAAAPRSWRDVVAVFLQAGQGLAAAHAAGIVHRDFKPDNVLVGADGRVRVLDFGLARPNTSTRQNLLESDDSLSILLTRADSLIGTPAYMSPEQHLKQPADARSDQFSFCLTLWEALYGQRPFQGRTIADLRLAVFERLPAPSRAARVPRRFLRILARGLQPAPEQRYPELRDLLDDLAVDPALRWRRVGLLALFLVAAAVIAALAARPGDPGPRCTAAAERLAGVWDGPRSAATREAASAVSPDHAAETWPRVQAAIDAYASAWVSTADAACDATRGQRVASEELLYLRNQCLDDDIRDLRALVDTLLVPDAVTLERALEAVQNLPQPARCLDETTVRARIKPPSDPALAAAVDAVRGRLAHADALLDLGRPREAAAIADDALYAAVAVDHAPLHAELLLTLGRAAADDFAYAPAHAHLTRAFDAALAAAHDEVASEAALLATSVLIRDARQQDALVWSRHASGMITRTGDPPRRRVLALLDEAYILASIRFQTDEALDVAERALALAEASLPPHDVLLARITFGVARVYDVMNEQQEALPLFIRVREEWGDILGPDHPLLARTDFYTGRLLYERDHDVEGLAQMNAAVTTLERAQGADHPDVATLLDHLARIVMRDGRLHDAAAMARRAAAILTARLGHDHYDTIRQHRRLFDILLDLTEYTEALALGRDLLARYQARIESGQEQMLQVRTVVRTHVSDVLLDSGRLDDAERECLAALEDAEHVGRQSHIHLLHNLAQIARLRGDFKNAERHIEWALRLNLRGHSDSIPLMVERAELHLALGASAEAAVVCEEAIELDKFYTSRIGFVSSGPYLCLGRALLGLGILDPAIATLERALEIVNTNDSRAIDHARIRSALAQALRRRDPTRAATLTAQARVYYTTAGPLYAAEAARVR